MHKKALAGLSFLVITVTCFPQSPATVTLSVDVRDTAQRIDNIGASAAWFSEYVGKYWPEATREKMARWLFSKEYDRDGNPEGIGLSAFRFNLGGGTAEQGDSSGIKDFKRRVECFLQPDGQYDWSRQSGYLWFVRKAKAYGVANLIAFSNTPPVQFTTNGLGFKTEKDHRSNLGPDHYADFANFMVTVARHFREEGLIFNYISPVNEPQWEWTDPYGKGGQEGTTWTNDEIAAIVRSLDSALSAQQVRSRILITEAGNLEYLYGHTNGQTNHQVQRLFGTGSPLEVKGLSHVPPVIGGHSYFTDKGDSLRIAVRKHLADTARKYGVSYWQTEYSMLGDGYKEGRKGRIPAMDCALFLAKVIHDDLVYGNAKAWQFWNSWEPADSAWDTRYCLIALHPSNDHWTNGTAAATKNLWALGHYSRFIRPGMQRLEVVTHDGLSDEQREQQVMTSAFIGSRQLVLVAINYSDAPKLLKPVLRHFGKVTTIARYVTAADKSSNMRYSASSTLGSGILLPPRSINSIVISRR
jgi:O-glycosyl hydrolase